MNLDTCYYSIIDAISVNRPFVIFVPKQKGKMRSSRAVYGPIALSKCLWSKPPATNFYILCVSLIVRPIYPFLPKICLRFMWQLLIGSYVFLLRGSYTREFLIPRRNQPIYMAYV
jgi:hypothetical protein